MTVAAVNKPRYHGLKVTREEYLDLEDDGYKYDVVDGVMVMAPSPNFEHGTISSKLIGILYKYLEKHPVATMTNETDIFLPDDGHVVRPDISILLNENLHIVKTHIHGTPDITIEILSASTMHKDLGEKADRYLACGVKEYWIIDPETRTLRLWSNRGHEWNKQEGESVVSKLLPDFKLSRSDLWP